MGFADLRSRMNRSVDDRLGETISYAVNGTAFTDVKGFVFLPDEDDGDGQIDTTTGHYRCKIRKDLIPEPLSTHRMRCVDILGNTVWRPTTGRLTRDGQHRIFNIQKV